MTFFRFLRGVSVLIWAPVLTLAVSLATLFLVLVLRRPPSSAHALGCLWGRLIAGASGVTVQVEGGGKLERSRPYIFAANHQSQFDIFALQGFLGHEFRWLAKKELFEVPIWGRAMLAAGYIPIDRSHGRAAMKSLEEAAARIAAGTSVIIFPEGTRSRDGRLQAFKAGGMVLAIKSQVPVVPVAVAGTYEVLPKGKLLVKPGNVRIRIGEPIETKGCKPTRKHELADRVREALAEMLTNC